MNYQLSDEDATILADVAKKVGQDPYKVKRENPFTKSGNVAKQLQVGVAELYPVKAAEWRSAVDGGVSAGTIAELKAGNDLSPQAMADLWAHDGKFVQELIQSRQQQEKDLEAKFAAEADRMLRKREGDETVDRQNAKAEADAKARAESAERARQLQQRIDQRRANTDRMAGQVIQ